MGSSNKLVTKIYVQYTHIKTSHSDNPLVYTLIFCKKLIKDGEKVP